MIEAGLNDLMMSMFVNNVKIMASKKSGIIQYIKSELTTLFSIIEMGFINFYLGLKIEQNQANQMIKLLQLAYINKVFSRFYLDQTYTLNTLIKKIALF